MTELEKNIAELIKKKNNLMLDYQERQETQIKIKNLQPDFCWYNFQDEKLDPFVELEKWYLTELGKITPELDKLISIHQEQIKTKQSEETQEPTTTPQHQEVSTTPTPLEENKRNPDNILSTVVEESSEVVSNENTDDLDLIPGQKISKDEFLQKLVDNFLNSSDPDLYPPIPKEKLTVDYFKQFILPTPLEENKRMLLEDTWTPPPTVLDKHVTIFKDCTTKVFITSIPVLTSIGLAKLGVIDSSTPQSLINLGFSTGLGLAKLGVSGVKNTLVTGAASLVIYNQVDPYKRGLFEGFVVGKYGPTLERVKKTTSYLYSRMTNPQTTNKPLETDVSSTPPFDASIEKIPTPDLNIVKLPDKIPPESLNIVKLPDKIPDPDLELHSIWDFLNIISSITWKFLKKIQYFLS